MAFISGLGDRTPTLTDSGKNPTFFRVVSQRRRAGPAGRGLHRQAPASEGADDRRRPGGLLDRSGVVDDPDLPEGRDQGRPRVGQPEGDRLLLAGGARSRRRRPWWSCRGRSRPTPSSSARTSPSRRRRPIDRRNRRHCTHRARSRSRARTCRRSVRTSPRSPPTRRSSAAAKAAYPKFGTFGPPIYAATHVHRRGDRGGRASRGRRRAGTTCWRRSRRRDEATSILGQPIHFDSKGDLIDAKWFLFKINQQGKYNAGHRTRDRLTASAASAARGVAGARRRRG